MLAPTLFIPHGGGPLPVLGDPSHAALTKFLQAVPARIPQKPSAILVVSAHWEEAEPQLTSSPDPGLMYDYNGFPPESYSIKYPAPGSPQLAQQAADLLRPAGFNVTLNSKRALDHGSFIPLKLMYPDADIPVVQLSLKNNLDPEEHYRMGVALSPLREQNVLLLGSGLSFHNMQQFLRNFAASDKARSPAGQDFHSWLLKACTADPGQRRQLLGQWAEAPGAKNAHPREEHLLPLMVIAGAAHGAEAAAEGTCSSSGSEPESKGHVLWDGECLGAAVAGIGFGTFTA